MKYYHLIYNSSQRSQDGSAGLGVRTYTKGMPQDYIDLLNVNEFFNYFSGNLMQPSPNVLLEDGKIILDYPATYRFDKLYSAATGKDIYVLSRTVTVGFDYPYYVEFEAARVDNFVTDVYVFEEPPTAEVFEMLYETPKEGCVSFIPRDRVPSPENEEMRSLSLGEMALLEEEEKSFECQGFGQVSELAFELLFAYIESCRQRLPLLVKCSATDAPSLMADLIRLLPDEMKEEAFFYTNYQLEGVKEGYKVFFVNEHYRYDYESTGQYYVFDVTQNAKAATEESSAYREEWKQLYLNGNTDDYFKRLSWVLCPAYELVRGKSIATKRVFFDYIVEPRSFNFNHVYNGDDELLISLSEYFSKDRSRQQLFDKQLETYLVSDNIKGNDCISLLKFTNKLESKGFQLTEVIANAKKAVSRKLLESPEILKDALGSIGIEKLSKYFSKEVFEGKKEYLNSEELKKDWAKVYKYFYSAEEQADKVKVLSKMFSLNLPENVVDEVIKGFGLGDMQLCDHLAEVAKRNPAEIDIPFKRIKDILDSYESRGLELPKPELADKIDKYVVSPLMKDPERPNGIESCHELLQLLGGKFEEQNAAALLARALKMDTRQSASLLFNKGLLYVKEKDVDAVVDQILKNVKPETMEFIVKVEKHPCKVQLLAAYFKKNGDNKRAVEKLRKEGNLKLTDAEFEDLISRLASAKTGKGGGPEESGNALLDWIKRLSAPVLVVLLLIGYFVFWHHPKEKDAPMLKLEVYAPAAGEILSVKEYLKGITAESAVPEGSSVGDIYADTLKGKENVVYFKVIAEDKMLEDTQQLEEQVTDSLQSGGQQPELQQTEENQEESSPEAQQPEEVG